MTVAGTVFACEPVFVYACAACVWSRSMVGNRPSVDHAVYNHPLGLRWGRWHVRSPRVLPQHPHMPSPETFKNAFLFGRQCFFVCGSHFFCYTMHKPLFLCSPHKIKPVLVPELVSVSERVEYSTKHILTSLPAGLPNRRQQQRFA